MDVPAYLARIGYEGPRAPTLDSLRALHRRHLLAVPFENLDIHLGHTILLDEESFFDKIVCRRRGGFCYELNGLFAALLRELGFDLDLLSARVAHEDGSFGHEYDHALLLVRLGGERWMADVGFGDSFLEPLRLDERAEQWREGLAYLVDVPDQRYLLLRHEKGEWSQKYLFTTQPRRLEEFAGMCEYHQTSPLSSFTRGRVCTLATPRGRITLADLRMIVTENGARQERTLAEHEYEGALREHFGIDLPNARWRPPLGLPENP